MASDKTRRAIIANKDNEDVKFVSVSEAARQLNIKRTNVKSHLKSGKPE
jgi:biotin operon repressor